MVNKVPETDKDLYQAVGRLEGKVDALLTTNTQLIKEQETLASRQNDLENKQSRMLGIGAGMAIVVTLIINFFGSLGKYLQHSFGN